MECAQHFTSTYLRSGYAHATDNKPCLEPESVEVRKSLTNRGWYRKRLTRTFGNAGKTHLKISWSEEALCLRTSQ